MIEITEETFDDAMRKNKFILLDFWAYWCKPCMTMEPTLAKLESIIRIGKINIDKETNLAVRFSVKSIPTLIIFKDRNIIQRYTGVQQFNVLKEFIDSLTPENG